MQERNQTVSEWMNVFWFTRPANLCSFNQLYWPKLLYWTTSWSSFISLWWGIRETCNRTVRQVGRETGGENLLLLRSKCIHGLPLHPKAQDNSYFPLKTGCEESRIFFLKYRTVIAIQKLAEPEWPSGLQRHPCCVWHGWSWVRALGLNLHQCLQIHL